MAAPIVSFKDIWRAFMSDPPVREWLFNRSPLSHAEAWACVTNHPEPLSFSFDPSSVKVTGAENLHDFAQLSTVLYHTGGVALGVTFGNGNKQPVLPMAKALINDPEFEDNRAVVRRCAIRRYSPRSRHLVRLQADWFQSGVLGFDFAFIPADNPDIHPSVGFAVFGYRMFKKSEAAALYHAAMYPSQAFLDGTTPLLTPADGYLTLDACDSQFQTPCMYCASRNTVLCHCPAPLRRRVEQEGSPDGMIQALTTNTGASDSSDEAVKEMVWRYFAHRMKSSLNFGTFITNLRYERPSAVPVISHVLVTHVIPYALLFNNTGAQTPIVQRAITALGLSSKHPQQFPASAHFPLSITNGSGSYNNDGDIRKWKCDQCTAVIRGKRINLTRHIQNKHARVRAFKCDNCPKRFRTRLNQVRHQKLVHEGSPSRCGNCPRAFKTQEKLQKHLDSVHAPGVNTLACPLCNGCYRKLSTLSRHINSVHL